MTDTVITELQDLERNYYEGVGFQDLTERVERIAARIAAGEACDAATQACQTFAPLLWGGKAGDDIDGVAITRALRGAYGDTYLRAWIELGRVVLTYRIAA